MNDIEKEWNWVTSMGNEGFVKWHAGEPENNANANCVFIVGKRLGDIRCSARIKFICEKDTPEMFG